MTLLSIDHVSVNYGAVQAIRDVSFTVGRGEIVTLIGANGAGKSTTLRAVSGVIRPPRGASCTTGNRSQVSRPTGSHGWDRPRTGGSGVFANMSVRENLEMGIHPLLQKRGGGEFRTVFGLFPRLAERASQLAGTLSGGEQQMLVLGGASSNGRPAASRRAVHGLSPCW